MSPVISLAVSTVFVEVISLIISVTMATEIILTNVDMLLVLVLMFRVRGISCTPVWPRDPSSVALLHVSLKGFLKLLLTRFEDRGCHNRADGTH